MTEKNEKKELSQTQWNRLQPFLIRKGARQKVILYLLALGYSPGDLCSMRVSVLKKIKLPSEIGICFEEILETTNASGLAFVYKNSGRVLQHPAYYHLISQTTKKVLNKPLTYKQFKTFISTGKK